MMYREIPYNFGALPMPAGYRVAWFESLEHYMAVCDDGWEGDISVDPYWCRRQAVARAAKAERRKALEDR